MKVRMIVNLGWRDYPDTPFMDGEVHEVTEKLGKLLVARKVAVEIPQELTPAPKASEPPAKKHSKQGN